jgi:hypothetical protein
MDRKRVLQLIVLLLMTASLLLTACGGGNPDEAPTTSTPAANSDAPAENNDDTGDEEAPAVEAPTATLTFVEQIPDVLIIHPDAFDFEVSAVSDTYVYIVPMMVAEATEYMLTELAAIGWEELGKPTIMGHLATLNMQMDKSRLTISMQDNEHSETTRIQMVLMQQ